jgi:transposase
MGVRYPDGGGLTAEGRARREAVRLQAAVLFAQEVPVAQIAQRLRVSQNAVYVWRRRWLAGGEAGLVSKGASGNDCKLTAGQVDKLAALLQEGPAAHGWVEDQRWTLARVADLIASRFRVRYTLRGVSILLHRMGFSPQIPKHRPVERDDVAVATWRREVWPQAKR